MSSHICIRRVGVEEVDGLRNLSVATFIDTYAEHNTTENMKNYIAKSFNIARLRSELASLDTAYYFAELGEQKVGYLRLNFGTAQTNQSLENACEIERIYVDRKFQGHKIGKRLFETAVNETQKAELKWLWLGVWDQNTKAIGFYNTMGFEVFGRHDFNLGTEAQTDLLMRLPITPDVNS